MVVYSRHLQPRLLNASLADSRTGPIRRRVCAGLSGDVLEIGFGSGLNLPHLPPEVRSLAAVEPSQVALRLSAARRAASPVPVTVVGDDAQHLPLADGSVDAALSTWNLCGIDDPAAVLQEVRRVLRPGGALHFVEHGLAPDSSAEGSRWSTTALYADVRPASAADRCVPSGPYGGSAVEAETMAGQGVRPHTAIFVRRSRT